MFTSRHVKRTVFHVLIMLLLRPRGRSIHEAKGGRDGGACGTLTILPCPYQMKNNPVWPGKSRGGPVSRHFT